MYALQVVGSKNKVLSTLFATPVKFELRKTVSSVVVCQIRKSYQMNAYNYTKQESVIHWKKYSHKLGN